MIVSFTFAQDGRFDPDNSKVLEIECCAVPEIDSKVMVSISDQTTDWWRVIDVWWMEARKPKRHLIPLVILEAEPLADEAGSKP